MRRETRKTVAIVTLMLLAVSFVAIKQAASLSEPVFADTFDLATYAWPVFESPGKEVITDYTGVDDTWQIAVKEDTGFFIALPKSPAGRDKNFQPNRDFLVRLTVPVRDENPAWFGIFLMNTEAIQYHFQINGIEYRVVAKQAGGSSVELASGSLELPDSAGGSSDGSDVPAKVGISVAITDGKAEFFVDDIRLARLSVDRGSEFWTGISVSGKGVFKPSYFGLYI